MSAAELALGARVDGLTPADVQAALWQDRTLVKTWAMRGTLHLIAAADLPLYVAARSFHDGRNWVGYFAYYGVPQAQYEALLAAIPAVLGSEPLTREQLATAVAERVGAPELRDLMLASSWGSPMKPSAFRGDLCFGPSQGTNVTFVRPSAWLGPQAPVEPYPALQEVARRYLRACGPATPEDFARWWEGGGGLALARKLFRSLGDELAAVDVEGWPAFALRDTLEPMRATPPPPCVRLLPMFDAYTLGVGRNMDALVDGGVQEPGLSSPGLDLRGRPRGRAHGRRLGIQAPARGRHGPDPHVRGPRGRGPAQGPRSRSRAPSRLLEHECHAGIRGPVILPVKTDRAARRRPARRPSARSEARKGGYPQPRRPRRVAISPAPAASSAASGTGRVSVPRLDGQQPVAQARQVGVGGEKARRHAQPVIVRDRADHDALVAQLRGRGRAPPAPPR